MSDSAADFPIGPRDPVTAISCPEPLTQRRFALLYSDGSIGVLEAGTDYLEATRQRDFVDTNEHDPQHFTRVAIVQVTIIEILQSQTAAVAP